jgi:hypothetical protein
VYVFLTTPGVNPVEPALWRRGHQMGNWSEAISCCWDAESVDDNSSGRMASGSGRMSRSTVAKAREALCAAICFSMSVAACIGLSQILLVLIECPQSLQIMEVPPAIVRVLMYMP